MSLSQAFALGIGKDWNSSQLRKCQRQEQSPFPGGDGARPRVKTLLSLIPAQSKGWGCVPVAAGLLQLPFPGGAEPSPAARDVLPGRFQDVGVPQPYSLRSSDI